MPPIQWAVSFGKYFLEQGVKNPELFNSDVILLALGRTFSNGQGNVNDDLCNGQFHLAIIFLKRMLKMPKYLILMLYYVGLMGTPLVLGRTMERIM